MTEDIKIDFLIKRVEALEALLANHHHDGLDGSANLSFHQSLNDLQEYRIANSAYFTGATQLLQGQELTRAVITSGRDNNPTDGFDNSQLVLEHNYTAAGNLSFYYGTRSPLYTGIDASVKSGSGVLKQNSYKWTPDELVGCAVHVTSTTTGAFKIGTVLSNTETTVTLESGTWGFNTKEDGIFVIFVPVYLGGGNVPWRRAYVTEGTGGGLRFGFGATGDGNNGLLYMDSVGDLYWRTKAGSSTKIN